MQNDFGLYELVRQALEEQQIFRYWTELELGVFSIAQYPENVNHSFVLLDDLLEDYGIRPSTRGLFISRERNRDKATNFVYEDAIVIEIV